MKLKVIGRGGERYRVSDWPVGEVGGVTEVSEVVDVTEELVVQLGEADDGDGAVLVQRPRIALQPWAEVCQVGGDLLDHQTPANTPTC